MRLDLNLSVRFLVRDDKDPHDPDEVVVCYRHSIIAAMTGANVQIEVDEFGQSDYDMRTTVCKECEKESADSRREREVRGA